MFLIVKRNLVLKLSIVLNVCVLLYVCAHLTSSSTWVEEVPSYWSGGSVGVPLAEAYNSNDKREGNLRPIKPIEEINKSITLETKKPKDKIENRAKTPAESKTVLKSNETEKKKPVRFYEIKIYSRTKNHQSLFHVIIPKSLNRSFPPKYPESTTRQLKDAIICNEISPEPRIAQRGDYWVLYNYVPMSLHVKCWESVTYATHADFTFFNNIVPLLERWRAPVSIALYAPGTDFNRTVNSIKYARNCLSPLISQLVTFHIYFSSKHIPKSIPKSSDVVSADYNCALGQPWVNMTSAKTYKSEKKLPYPINVGRNIARENSRTRYVLLCDIELYPSPNLPDAFLEMIRRNDQEVLLKPNPKVFVLPIFEVDEKSQPPKNKTVLLSMLKNGSAIPFHKKVCAQCHNQPRSKEWQETPETDTLQVFHTGKRTGKFIHWEPIFIGTNAEPLYDERLTWEGRSDKMLQGYAMCVLDYDLLILNNAFLTHRPGIKIYKKNPLRDAMTAKMNMLIHKIFLPEMKVLYGTRKGCAL